MSLEVLRVGYGSSLNPLNLVNGGVEAKTVQREVDCPLEVSRVLL